MEKLQQEFAKSWAAARAEMETRNVGAKRMEMACWDLGDLAAAKRILGGRRCSDGFDALAKQGRLDLTVEALACRGKFGPLFSDEEVNTALERLLEAGYRF